MKNFFFLILLFISQLSFSQSLEQFSKDAVSSSSISTNSISNMFYLNGKTWFGSSSGLNYFENNQFNKIETGNSLLNSKSVYSISGKSNKVFTAIGETRKKNGENIPTAMGFGLSSDNGNTWSYLEFPLEDKNKTSIIFGKDTLIYLPILVPEQSVSYDCAIDGDTLWTASYASGILVSTNNGIPGLVPLRRFDGRHAVFWPAHCGRQGDVRLGHAKSLEHLARTRSRRADAWHCRRRNGGGSASDAGHDGARDHLLVELRGVLLRELESARGRVAGAMNQPLPGTINL